MNNWEIDRQIWYCLTGEMFGEKDARHKIVKGGWYAVPYYSTDIAAALTLDLTFDGRFSISIQYTANSLFVAVNEGDITCTSRYVNYESASDIRYAMPEALSIVYLRLCDYISEQGE